MNTVSFVFLTFKLILLFKASTAKYEFENIEESLSSTMDLIKAEMRRVFNKLNSLETSIDRLSYDRGILKENQNLLNSKLNDIILDIEDVCKTRPYNTLSTTVPTIPDFPHLGSCEKLTPSLVSAVSFFVNLNTSQYHEAISNLSDCFQDLPESMEGYTYFQTPKLKQEVAAKFCENQGAKPFIPKNLEEFIYYVAMTAEPKSDLYSWYPINDIETEGHLVLQDGTDYEGSIFKLPKWSKKWENSEDADCVTVDIFGEASWSRCYHYDFVLLCRKEFDV